MEDKPHRVVVTDIHMSFMAMVVFIVKWAIASIPALLILFLFGLVLTLCTSVALGLGNFSM